MFSQDTIFQYLVRAMVLFTAMPIHECAHGYVAYRLGDDTAYHQGRLTLNPFAHLDLLGGALLIFAGFGWAKPVQIDTRRFAHPQRDIAISSLAGPASNVLLALVVLIVFKLLLAFHVIYGILSINVSTVMVTMLNYMVVLNLYLAVFNMLPVPPLDGFKVFGSILPRKFYFFVLEYERYITIAVFLLIFNGFLRGPIQGVSMLIYQLLDLITRPLDWI